MARVDFHVATHEGSSANEVLAYPHSGDAADGLGPKDLTRGQRYRCGHESKRKNYYGVKRAG